MTQIVEFRAEGYRRLSLVQIKPDGSLVKITGKNGQGKTSLLNAIAVTLGGKALAPREPIKKGQERAVLTATLSNGAVVRREFWRGKGGAIDSDLTVEIDNSIRRSPQAYLSDMIGDADIAFDPLEFSRMEAKDQFKLLAGLVKGYDFAAEAKADKDEYDERTLQNRIAHNAKIEAEGLSAQIGTLPEILPDATEIVADLEAALATNNDIEARRKRREDAAARIDALDEEIERAQARLAGLQRERADLAAKLAEAPALPEPIDTDELHARLRDARRFDAIVGNIQRRDSLMAQAKAAADRAAELTASMERRKAARAKAIAEAKLPVPGLGLEDGAVTLGGLPFDQASGAEQLRVSVALAMARNPKLRVMLVDEASSLDQDQLALIAQMAEDRDYQVWLVRVAVEGQKSGFVIEDGRLA